MRKGFTLVELVGVVIILGIVVLLAFPPLLGMIRDANREITKANETLLLTATDQYVDTYKNDFPKTDGNVYCVSYGDLIKDEKIPSNIPNKDGKTLDYNTLIKVTVNNGKYEYALDNSCERNVKITSLVELLKQQYKEGNTSGLLKDEDGSYYYKGTNEEVSNNFVWFAGHLWRVLTINEDNSLTMITQQPISAISPASSAWTTEQEYKDSYINHWLNSEEDGVFYKSLTNEDKDKILYSSFDVGIPSDAITENINITTIQKVGLLDKDQYIKMGGQNSFLDIKDYWWLGTRYGSSYLYRVGMDGSLGGSVDQIFSLSNSYGIRAVIKISNLTFTEGEGTLSNPYREKREVKNITQIKVGEYISIPTSETDCGEDNRCLFRVVSNEGNKIKVTLNGLLPNESQFGSTATYTSGNTIDTVVTTFANTIDIKYRYQGTDAIFGIGAYKSRTNYNSIKGVKYTGTVGIPVVGEMFTTNDIDMSTSATKTFVNINTIENPTVSYFYWTMNSNGTSDVYFVSSSKLSDAGAVPTKAYGVRPVLFLNNNLTFTGGEGTAENPFTLE